MTKKYELVRDKIRLPGGGFVEAVRMALVDFSCLGLGRHVDLAGYPHESVDHALMSDWAALGVDFKAAEKQIAKTEAKREPDESASGPARKAAAAA